MPGYRVVRPLLALFALVGRPFFLLSVGLAIVALFALGKLANFLSLVLYILGKAVMLAVDGMILWAKLLLANLSEAHRLSLPFPQILVKKRVWVVAGLIVATTLMFSWAKFLIALPQPGQLLTRDQAVSTKIYDRKGRLLFKIYKKQNRTLLPLDQIPLPVRQATVAIEDAEFYNHHGFSIRGIARAVRRNLAHGQLSGGSTITQQLVKNALLSPEKTLGRKLKEIILSVRVELAFTKDQILEMYLNEVSYGHSAYGIEEGAQLYFGKSARDLSLAESALLAGLPRSPTTHSPFGANPQFARARQLEVLSRMVQEEYIRPEEADLASREELELAPQKKDIHAPHFVMYVKQLLVEKYGERMVEEGGLQVITSLDLDIQEMVQAKVTEEVKSIAHLNISNGAAIVTNPQTGEILAMVGSIDYFDTKIDGNFNVTTASRQPGSSIKPINYAYALESRKYTPVSLLSDTPITYASTAAPSYSPRNYDNKFRGSVTLRTALGSSLNVPAVKTLASYGVDKMVEQARKMGITTWENPSRFGLSLTLGGGEVKPIDMAVVYGTLANYGERVDLKPILEVTDYRGRVLEDGGCKQAQSNLGNWISWSLGKLAHNAYAAQVIPPKELEYKTPYGGTNDESKHQGCDHKVLDPIVAFQLTDILRDNNARTPAFGPNSLLVIPNHPEVAVKTGTTQNLRDNWAIGYTKDFVVVTWVGNNNNRPMAYVASGVTGATPIWHKITNNLISDKPPHEWSIPEGLAAVQICPSTGTLPCNGCGGKTEYFLAGTEPTYACIPKQQAEKEEDELPDEQRQGEIL